MTLTFPVHRVEAGTQHAPHNDPERFSRADAREHGPRPVYKNWPLSDPGTPGGGPARTPAAPDADCLAACCAYLLQQVRGEHPDCPA